VIIWIKGTKWIETAVELLPSRYNPQCITCIGKDLLLESIEREQGSGIPQIFRKVGAPGAALLRELKGASTRRSILGGRASGMHALLIRIILFLISF